MTEKSAQQGGEPRETGEDRGHEKDGKWKLRPLIVHRPWRETLLVEKMMEKSNLACIAIFT